MAKIISETLAAPDDPIYREPARAYNPHWSHALRPAISKTEADLFRRCRWALGLSQAEIAVVLRVASDRTIRRWEAGTLPITGAAWVALRYMLSERRMPLVDDVEKIIIQRRAKQSDAVPWSDQPASPDRR